MMDHEVYIWLTQLTRRIEELEEKTKELDIEDNDDDNDENDGEEDNDISIRKKDKEYQRDKLVNTR